MTAEELVRYLTEIPFIVIFLVVVLAAVRRPTRTHWHVAFFFGVLAAVVVGSWLAAFTPVRASTLRADISASLLMALPYLLLQIIDDVAGVPRAVLAFAGLGLAASVTALFLAGPELPAVVTLPLVAYFVLAVAYAAYRFVQAARRSGPVTRRRMEAAAIGSALLGTVLLLAGVSAVAPGDAAWTTISRVAGLTSAIAYLVAFAPPRFMRRAWQEPELLRFLARASELPRLPSLVSVVGAVEAGIAASVGSGRASVLLWDEDTERFVAPTRPEASVPPQGLVAQAFASQSTAYVENTLGAHPEYRDLYERAQARAIIAAPITAGTHRLGTLSVYSERAPLFADSDVELVTMLADQTAILLESHLLLEEAARVRGRDEAARLKEDFLSGAAHDLRTPLTTILGQAQLLERRARRRPDEPVDIEGIRRIVREAEHTRLMVNDLLDVSRADGTPLSEERELVDLSAIARQVAAAAELRYHTLVVAAADAAFVLVDSTRLGRVVQNLLDNAVKYSPDGGEVRLSVLRNGDEVHLSVTDHGIGIPAHELGHLFERFWRSSLVDDRRFAGMGLGLYICRRFVEAHDGRIWAESIEGKGSTFHVALPLAQQEDVP